MTASVLNKSRQKGLTAGGWLLILSLVGFFVLLTLRLFPLYYNHFKIRGVVESFTEESGLYEMTRSRMLSIINKRLNISLAEGFKPEHLVIELKNSGKKEIHIRYEDRRQIFGKLDVIASFDDYVIVSRNGKVRLGL